MEYNELTIPDPGTVDRHDLRWVGPPKYAIEINDFDSMCIRLVWQLSTEQIERKLAEARKMMYADACEKLTKEMGGRTKKSQQSHWSRR